ncbi:MAG: glycosyltransferase family 4 protein [bacterium]
MIDTSPNGGIAHYTYNLCQALSAAGVEVILLTHRDYELGAFPCSFAVKRRFYKEETYLVSWNFVMREISAFGPDVVHFQTLIAPRKDWFFFLLLKLLGKKVVFTAHNVLPHETRFLERSTYGWIYGLASAVILHAEQNKTDFLKIFPISQSKLWVIPHGSYAFFSAGHSVSKEEARKRLRIPLDAGVILFFGAIRPYKGLHELIRAFSELLRRGNDAFLVIAGKVMVGTEEEYWKSIRDHGVENRVVFRPEYIPFEEVAPYFSASDMVALPYDHIYDSGILHIALAMGVPVVATKVGSFIDHVQEGETGHLVPAGDAHALVNALESLLKNKASRLRMGENAMRYDRQHFGWERIALKTEGLYKNISGQKSRDGGAG